MYTHIKEKPSKYTFRDKSISGRYILNLHLITHTKENLINVCFLELCLIYEKTLNVNLRIHTEEKTGECDYITLDKLVRKSHIKIKQNGKGSHWG